MLLGLTAVLAICAGCTSTAPPATHTSTPSRMPAARVSPMTDISSRCGGGSSEVEEATSAPGYVYATWIGCGGIGFARSTDSGYTFGSPVTVPGSAGHSWDPAIATAPDGTVYVSYMHADGPAGVAYIAWQTSAPAAGYTTYLRPFAIRTGWLGPAVTVSTAHGNPAIWPGDTFGITPLPGAGTRLSLIWGSAVRPSKLSEIYASVVTLST